MVCINEANTWNTLHMIRCGSQLRPSHLASLFYTFPIVNHKLGCLQMQTIIDCEYISSKVDKLRSGLLVSLQYTLCISEV